MKQQPEPSEIKIPDVTSFADNMTKVMETLAGIANDIADQQHDSKGGGLAMTTLENVSRTFAEVAKEYVNNPERAIEAQMRLWQSHAELWQNTWRRFLGEDVGPVVAPEPGDRRFKDEAWEQSQVFDFLKQSYLITAYWAKEMASNAEDVDAHTRRKAEFYVEQLANALSPSNFAVTNPEVLRLTMESNGENLVEGLKKLAQDLRDGDGGLRIRQTDLTAFEVGKNMALSPGKVVFQNELMQLIQYAPTTEQVHQRPLLIVPPWINKFYILDLNEKKSFIRWAVAQGLTVFVISWVNPDERLAQRGFADYMKIGVLGALDAVEQATGQKKVNTIGYCIGGTMLAATAAYMAAHKDKRIASATFFTTQVDFEEAGDLLVFVDKDMVAGVEDDMATRGYLDGKKMATAFNMLRSNDLIWSYVVNNYLKGKDPMPFDLLFWNSDSTRMPAATHSQYLRGCYLNNDMSQGRMELDGTTIDLKQITIPVYNLAAREDHIAPLPSVFKIGRFLGGDTRLVVAGSGHIAGVVNPPEAGKYQYWTNDGDVETLEKWLDGATEHPGSWWPDWISWLKKRSGKLIPARVPGDGKLEPIEDAPGTYVTVRGK